MPSLLALTAPFALLLPLLGQSTAQLQADAETEADGKTATAPISAPDYDTPPEGPYSPARPVASPLDAFRGGQITRQARIEQRVIIRITPRRSGVRNDLLARLPRRGLTTQYEEREMDRCLPVNTIAGVQTGNGNRLLLFLEDQRMISVNLERACRASQFYSGFYVERNEDGRLCVGRDALQSRSGAKCEVEGMRQLVAVTQ
ncbi:MAG: hypothetical protein ABJN35_10220 [Erythrobacter sp.]